MYICTYVYFFQIQDFSQLNFTLQDDLNDINALLIASSTVKPSGRKEPSGAEKKRAKLKREFLANLMVSTPEDPEILKKKHESNYYNVLFTDM